MNELRQLQMHAQRAIASAHLLDQQLELPATARLVAAARALVAEVAQLLLAAHQAPIPIVAVEAPVVEPAVAAPNEQPLEVGEEIEYEIAPGAWRRARVKLRYDSVLLGERMLWADWAHGSVELHERECRRAGMRP